MTTLQKQVNISKINILLNAKNNIDELIKQLENSENSVDHSKLNSVLTDIDKSSNALFEDLLFLLNKLNSVLTEEYQFYYKDDKFITKNKACEISILADRYSCNGSFCNEAEILQEIVDAIQTGHTGL